MKSRHIIPWIPIIGFIIVLLWPSDLYYEEQLVENYKWGFTEYMWGHPWLLVSSSAFQGICYFALILILK